MATKSCLRVESVRLAVASVCILSQNERKRAALLDELSVCWWWSGNVDIYTAAQEGSEEGHIGNSPKEGYTEDCLEF